VNTALATRKSITGDSYAHLRERVRETFLIGHERIKQAKVQTYWETGKTIQEYILKNKNRSNVYGKEVVARLAEDLKISERLLYQCIQFYEKKILHRGAESFKKLPWAALRTLVSLPDPKQRVALAAKAEKEEWTAEDLRVEVKKINAQARESKNGHSSKKPELLTPRKGQVYTYRLVRSEKIHPGKTDLRIDLGFSCYKEASMKSAAKFKAGDIVQSKWIKNDSYQLSALTQDSRLSPQNSLFTFNAYIERVVDGDTLLVQVDLGFGEWTRQYLRLRGINCPEINTSAGRRAKKFVESELENVPYVVISSSKSDKYDRYLADVFYSPVRHSRGSGNPEPLFLNNELLQHRLAERV